MKEPQNNEESKAPVQLSVEERQRLAWERTQKTRQENLQRQLKIIENFLPAISSISTKLISSHNAVSGLNETLQFLMQEHFKKLTLKELGAVEELDKYIAGDPEAQSPENGNPEKVSKFQEMKEIVIALGDWKISEINFALQWYSIQSKQFIDRSLKDLDLTELLTESKKVLDKQIEDEKNRPIPSPFLDK